MNDFFRTVNEIDYKITVMNYKQNNQTFKIYINQLSFGTV
jgi:hypothetical protein